MEDDVTGVQDAPPAEIEDSAPSTNDQAVNPEDSAPSDKPAEDPNGNEPPKKKEEPSKAVKELIAQRKRRQELEQENAYLRGQIDARKAPEPRTTETPKPTLDQFDTHEQYIEALTDWKVSDRLRGEIQRMKDEEAQKTEKQKAEKALTDFQGRMAKAKDKYDDIDEVIGMSTARISQPMMDAIIDSELGPDIMYYLANHPEEAEAMASMTSVGAMRAIGKLEGNLSTRAPEANRITKAPDPHTPAGGGGGIVNPKESIEDFMKRRNAEKAQRR